jgi:hypothetical protein
MTQLDIHKNIDNFLNAGVSSAEVLVAQELISENDDAKKYFFHKADESWIDWFWKNKIIDTTEGKIGIIEFTYLAKVAVEKYEIVSKIILSLEIKETNFDPGIIRRILWIMEGLPIEQLKDLIEKMEEEKWVKLMKDYRSSAYEFDRIIKSIINQKEYSVLLTLSSAMLAVRVNTDSDTLYIDKPFYLNHISDVKLFKHLADIDEQYIEKAFDLTLNVLESIIKEVRQTPDSIFKYGESYALYDIDIFNVSFDDARTLSPREDFQELVVTIKKLIEKVFKSYSSDSEKLKELFKKVEELSENRLVWRLKLYLLSLCPEIFKDEIKKAFFRVFEVGERYFEITGGAEYHKFLEKCFSIIDKQDQKQYIENVFEYFNAKIGDSDKEKWRKRDGKNIVLIIKEFLGEKKDEAEKIFDVSLSENDFVPTPSGERVRSGIVNHRAPESLKNYSVIEIVEKLKTEWIPEKLKETYKLDDFLSPRGAEGLGEELKKNFKERPTEYFDNICDFFDKEKIASNYLNSILRGIEEMFRDKNTFEDFQIKQMLSLFDLIKTYGRENQFKDIDDGSWLANWTTVHRTMSDIMLQLLAPKDKIELFQSENREQILDIILYLLGKDEKDEKIENIDLFSIAINSVKGRAYQSFIMFIQNDGKELKEDVKSIFIDILKTKSLAIRFLIGHYLAVVYFRDKTFVVNLLPEIFPINDVQKKDFYSSAWEGFLVNTLYGNLFEEMVEYYEYAIEQESENYTNRKYFKDIDEALGIHIALAFVYLGIEQDNSLFKLFWSKKNIKRQKSFVSFIGRSCLNKKVKEKIDKDKLINFWDWTLASGNNIDKEVFSAFSYWINVEKGTLDDKVVIERMIKTLEFSKGKLDWEYAFLQRLPIFAEKDSKNTLLAIRKYYFDSEGKLSGKYDVYSVYRDEVKEALDIIYSDITLKKEVEKLIENLIEKGSSNFWKFKEVIK